MVCKVSAAAHQCTVELSTKDAAETHVHRLHDEYKEQYQKQRCCCINMWHYLQKLLHHITALTKPKCRECCHMQSLYNDHASGCRHSYVIGCKSVCTLRHCQWTDLACDQLIITITCPPRPLTPSPLPPPSLFSHAN